MTEPSNDAMGREEQIAAILGGYLEAAEAGDEPDRALLLEQHPELASELAAFFDQQERFAGLVAPLRQAAQAARAEEPTEAGESSATPPSAEVGTWPEDDLPPGPGETVSAPPPPDRGDGDGGGDARDAPDPMPRGARVRYFGDYELRGVLGQGGMGVVYRAQQLSLNRPVALKMIRAGALAGDDEVRRFQNEAEAVANLDHPRIVTVHEVGRFRGRHYFSMKLIEGPSLDQQLGDFAARPRDAAGLVAEIARAVHHAHQRGILHRDLKPSNILLDPGGHPHVTDFGLAKRLEGGGALSVSGAIVGTPAYMSPEQAAGQRGAITTATDVYGLGTILYAMLTGKPPLHADSVLEALEQVRERAPQPPSKENRRVPRDLEVVCLKCLEKDPHRRYDSAAALADDLERYLAGKPIVARPVGSLERGWRWCRRNPVVAGSLGAAAAALLAVAGLSLLYAHRQARDAARIRQDAARTRQLVEQRTTESLRANLRNATLNYQRGEEACEQGEIGLGLLRLVASWRSAVAAGDLAIGWRHAARANLAAWQRHQPELHAVFSHAGPVHSAAFSPDGKTVITGSHDKTARLWDAATGQPLGPALTHQGEVNAVAFSPDGKTVITGSFDKTARLWDAATGQPLGPALTHQGQVHAVAFSPDGKTVMTGSSDNTARLWDAATGQPLGQTLVHQGLVWGVAFSPDGKTVMTGSTDKTARFWDAATGQPLGPTLVHQDQVRAVAFSPDGKTVMTGSADRTARFWDAATGQPLGPALSHRGPVSAVAFSPDGKSVMTGGADKTARFWDAATGQPTGAPLTHQRGVWAVAFSPDGKSVMTGSHDKTARLWDAATGRPLGQTLTHHRLTVIVWPGRRPSWIMAVAFSPDGKTVLTVTDDHKARLWNAADGTPVGSPMVPSRFVAFSPDGKTVLTGSWEKTARFWDAATGQPLGQPLAHQGRVWAVAFSPDGKTVLTGSMDQTARLWDAATGQPLGQALTHQGSVAAVAFSPDGKTVMTGSSDNTARLWDVATGRPLGPVLTHQDKVIAAAFSPDGKTVMTGSNDSTARLWDAATGQPLGPALTHQDKVIAVAFSPDGKTVMTGSNDSTARLWDAATGRPLGAILMHQGLISAIKFSPDGKTVMTGSLDNTARFWDAATGQPLGPALTHQGQVHAVAFSPDGKTAITGSSDSTARFWDVATALPDELERVAVWVEVLSGMELDELGSARVLDSATWHQRREKLKQLGGPPVAGSER